MEKAARFVTVADGLVAQVVPLAVLARWPRLDDLLRVIHRTTTTPLRIAGWSSECGQDRHRLRQWIDGTMPGLLEVRLRVCIDCGMVEVRDRSLDLAPGLHPGSLEPRRRDAVLGWYAGTRRLGRVFH